MNHQGNTHPFLKTLGFDAGSRVAIFHADDVGMCHGANVAFEELSRLGTIHCGSVMVPCPWFTEIAELAAANPSLDLGVHLTLTSEWATYRWAPISTTSRHSGLIDEYGYFWRRLPMLYTHVIPDAAEEEMRAQIDRALASGINVTHLDTHMGAAILPQLIDIYLRLGRDYKLPVLLPKHLKGYTSVLDFESIPLVGYEAMIARLEKKGMFLVDHFKMTLNKVDALPVGLTMIALHPNKSGDIEMIVPAKAHLRTKEYRLLKDSRFPLFVKQLGIQTIGFKPFRDLLRQKTEG